MAACAFQRDWGKEGDHRSKGQSILNDDPMRLTANQIGSLDIEFYKYAH